jgi:hypothetical protein
MAAVPAPQIPINEGDMMSDKNKYENVIDISSWVIPLHAMEHQLTTSERRESIIKDAIKRVSAINEKNAEQALIAVMGAELEAKNIEIRELTEALWGKRDPDILPIGKPSPKTILKYFKSIGSQASFLLAGNTGRGGRSLVSECRDLFNRYPALQAEMMAIGKEHFIFHGEMAEWVSDGR